MYGTYICMLYIYGNKTKTQLKICRTWYRKVVPAKRFKDTKIHRYRDTEEKQHCRDRWMDRWYRWRRIGGKMDVRNTWI